jgi:hypothetical protein
MAARKGSLSALLASILNSIRTPQQIKRQRKEEREGGDIKSQEHQVELRAKRAYKHRGVKSIPTKQDACLYWDSETFNQAICRYIL